MLAYPDLASTSDTYVWHMIPGDSRAYEKDIRSNETENFPPMLETSLQRFPVILRRRNLTSSHHKLRARLTLVCRISSPFSASPQSMWNPHDQHRTTKAGASHHRHLSSVSLTHIGVEDPRFLVFHAELRGNTIKD